VRAVPVVLAVAALVLVSAASARDPRDPQQRHTAADTRLARSVSLRPADLAAGWKKRPPSQPGPPCSAEPDESKLVQTAAIDPTYVWKDGVTAVGSEVDVFRTAAMARRDWRLSTLRVVRDCVLESARRSVQKGTRVRLVSAQSLGRLPYGERSLHYRLVFDLLGKKTVPVVTDLFGIGSGRVTIVLHTFSVGSPLPDSSVNDLVTLVAKRLKASRLGI